MVSAKIVFWTAVGFLALGIVSGMFLGENGYSTASIVIGGLTLFGLGLWKVIE